MMWECYMDNSSKGIYGIFLVRDILTVLRLNIGSPKYLIEAVDWLMKVTTSPMIDLGLYRFKYLNKGRLYLSNLLQMIMWTKNMNWRKSMLIQNNLTILYDKYEKADLNKVMKNKWQNLTEEQHNESLQLLQKSKELFDGELASWKTDPVEFELK